MGRRHRIVSASFAGVEMELPLSFRLGRSAEVVPRAGVADRFTTSVQTKTVAGTAELRLRGLSAAEGLAIGQAGELSVTTAPADGDGPQRVISVLRAVLTGIELHYEQSAMATAVLRFAIEAVDGTSDPVGVEDAE